MLSTCRSAFISTVVLRPSLSSPFVSSSSTFVPHRPNPLFLRHGFSSGRSTPRQRKVTKMTTSPSTPSSPPSVGIVGADLRQEMQRSYMEYAMSVILGRAMPDVRDGLKPVHRRILFAMHKLRLPSSGPFRKSARVVGEVLGKYHPHGDNAVYDALVRMAQSFSMCAPLVDGHGNFGSTDGDPAAAMRYTECRLSSIAQHALMADFDRGTTQASIIEFYPNFDASEHEPSVLPAMFPNLLVNGSSGIAVGMATNIPPHNLTEVVNACIALIQTPDIDDNSLFQIVPGPDFPTGGYILGTADARAVYRTGRGRVIVRACVHSEIIHADGTTTTSGDLKMASSAKTAETAVANSRKKREALVVTQLPYQVNKAGLVEKVAALVNDKKLEGISDLRDESDRTGTRIVIELKRDAKAPLVLQALFKKTALQSSFSANMMALDNGRFPQRFTLRLFLQRFIDFRRSVVRKRVQFDFDTAQLRLHLVEGYIKVLGDIDSVVTLIRAAKDSTSARSALIEQFSLSDTQAMAVLDLQLRRLTSLELDKLNAENDTLTKQIESLSAILDSPRKLDDVIVSELRHVASQYGVPRRSKIVTRRHPGGSSDPNNDGEFGLDMTQDEIDEMTLVQNVQNVITVTQHGYIKRMGTSLFESQGRGTRGKRGIGRLRAGDKISHLFTCMTHDPLIAVSATGMAFPLQAHKVPAGNTGSRGVPVFQLIPGVPDGQATDIAAVLPVGDVAQDDFLVLVSEKGYAKRVAVSDIVKGDSRGKRVMGLKPDNRLRFVKRCKEDDAVFITSKNGKVLRLDALDLRSSGRQAMGVVSMRLAADDKFADMDVVHAPTPTDENDFSSSGMLGEDEDEEEEEEDIDDDNGNEYTDGEEESEEGEDEESYLLFVSKNGKGKRVRSSDFLPRRRGGKGLIAMKLDQKPDPKSVNGPDCLVAMQTCRYGDSVMLVASDGTLVRTKVNKIPIQSRMSKGVRLQKLGDDVTVAAVTVVSGDVLMDSNDDDEDDDEYDDGPDEEHDEADVSDTGGK